MLFVDVLLKPVFSAEDHRAVFTTIPVLVLLVLQAKLTGVGRPSSITPATFDLIGMCKAIVQVLPNAIRVERPTTAMGHLGRWLK